MDSKTQEAEVKVENNDNRRQQQPRGKRYNGRQSNNNQENNNSAPRQFYNQEQYGYPRQFNRNRGRGGQYVRNPFYNQRNDGNEPRRDLGEEKKLAVEELVMKNRKYVIEVNENNLGKYIRLSEFEHRKRIMMTISVVIELKDRLIEFIKANETIEVDKTELAQQQNSNSRSERRIKTEAIIRENRRYFLDLKENLDGRFLRFTMMTHINRVSVTFPAENLPSLVDVFKKFITEFASVEELQIGGVNVLKQAQFVSQSVRARRGVMYYFDIGIDRRGSNYLRISDVRQNYRTAIVVPCEQWGKFRDVLSEYVEKLGIDSANLSDNTKRLEGADPSALSQEE